MPVAHYPIPYVSPVTRDMTPEQRLQAYYPKAYAALLRAESILPIVNR